MRNPFDNDPAPLALQASEQLQKKLALDPVLTRALQAESGGKMFGVLVVADSAGYCGYLAGYSGMLNQQWQMPGFVPPVFELAAQQSIMQTGEARLEAISSSIESLLQNPARVAAQQQLVALESSHQACLFVLKQEQADNKLARHRQRALLAADCDQVASLQQLSLLSQQDKKRIKRFKLDSQQQLLQKKLAFTRRYEDEINALKATRKSLSQGLHNSLFDTYQLLNAVSESISLKSLFDHLPPGGSGDCAAPKLLQYAYSHGLKPLELAEFWWGAAPAGGVRHHGHFYPPCRGKCEPILAHMLNGVAMQSASAVSCARLEPEVIYQDADILVLNKPAGLLSIPGKKQQHSVLTWLAENFPDARGALLAHRLDRDTSGLMLAAKNPQAHRALQRQFIERSISKRYVALLSKKLNSPCSNIELPLRVDLEDRPRQMVCHQHGKSAITRVEVIASEAGSTRVYFYPVTGRTHQLRVHAAHGQGLAAPIIGDVLYGKPAERLMLHADCIGFKHPASDEWMEFQSPVPF